MKTLALIFCLILALPVFSQDGCPGSCWSTGCCRPNRNTIPGTGQHPPRTSDCHPDSLVQANKEVCTRITVREALALEAAAQGVRVFISPDQRSALRCN